MDSLLKKCEAGDLRPLLKVSGLGVSLPFGSRQSVEAVREVSLEVGAGERVGVVGESGSGKSVTMRAIAGLLPDSSRVVTKGSVCFEGSEMLGASARDWREIRAKRIGMIFQDPMSYLNPTMRVGRQVHEALMKGRAAQKSPDQVARYLEMAGLSEPNTIVNQYPFQLSGGMRQRVLIAIALAKSPQLVIADEPTTALDATVQRHVLRSLDKSVRELGTSLLLISHDLGVVAGICDRIYVMFRGEVVEHGTVSDIFYQPQHDYTKDLLRSVRSFYDDSEELFVSKYART